MQKDLNITWFHYLLFSSHLRAVRYVLICFLLLLFSVGDVGYQYQDSGSGIITFSILCMASTVCKIIPVFIIIKVVMPQLLPRHRYGLFWSITFMIIFLSLLSQHGLECLTCYVSGIQFWRLRSGNFFNFYIIDFIIQFIQWFIVLMGLSMGYLLKYWTNEKNRMQKIQASKLHMESELLKEQVSPELLCCTLHNSGELALSRPMEASHRLMLLSKLLRYQLYDCRRRNVLFDGEVKFLNDFMLLNKLNGLCNGYSLKVEGNSFGIFVPPLLFVSFITKLHGFVKMLFLIDKDFITFIVEHDGDVVLSEHDVHRIKGRLDHIFQDDYKLELSDGLMKFKIPL